MKLLIVNQPLNNRGDESAHKGLVRSLAANLPNAEITVLFAGGVKDDTVRQFNVTLPNVEYIILPNQYSWNFRKRVLKLNIKPLWFAHPIVWRIFSYYRKADCVICAPGGICMGGFQDWMHLFYLYMAKLARKPLVYYGRSFGPFPTATWQNRRFKKISLEMINYFSFCSIRDKKTQILADEMGVKYEPTVDSAFLDSPEQNIPQEILDMIGGEPYVVFVPNSLIWHYAYKQYTKVQALSFYKEIYEAYVKKYEGCKVVMLPQTFNNGTPLLDDYYFMCELRDYLNDTNVVVVPDTYSSDIQQMVIKNAVCLVGARYHSVVFALNQDVPFVALSYEHKISGLLESLGKTANMVDITHVFESKDIQKDCVSKFKVSLDKAQTDSKGKTEAKNQAMECFNKLLTYLHTLNA